MPWMRSLMAFFSVALFVCGCGASPPADEGGRASVVPAGAVVCERSLSESAEAYLLANPEWALVTADSLAPDDRQLWETSHADRCPGVADVASDDDGVPQALTLLRTNADGTLAQRLVVVGGNGVIMLAQSDEIVRPSVVWVGSTGTVTDRETGEQLTIPRPPIVYEVMEAGSRVYWWTPEGFKSALASE